MHIHSGGTVSNVNPSISQNSKLNSYTLGGLNTISPEKDPSSIQQIVQPKLHGSMKTTTIRHCDYYFRGYSMGIVLSYDFTSILTFRYIVVKPFI